LDTKFFEDHTLKDKEFLRKRLISFHDNICDKASDEEQIVSEWEKIYGGDRESKREDGNF
jgi:hypothetical protein